MDKPRKDDIVEFKIDDIASEGNGIGRLNGEFVVFVPKTVPGDTVKARIKKTKKNYSEATLLELLEKSPFRVKPECRYFGTCNGCKMQNVEYQKQLDIKTNIVKSAMERIGGFPDLAVPGAIGSENIYFYRNKLEFSFSRDRWLTEDDMNNDAADRTFALGYHIPGFIEKVLDIEECSLQSKTSNKILNLTRDFFRSRGITVYTTKTHTGFLRFLVIRQAAVTGELMINLITLEHDAELMVKYSKQISESVPEVTTIVNSITGRKAQVAYAEESYLIHGKGFIEERIGNYRFKITPNSFFQTNSRQCEVLFEKAAEFAQFGSNESVLDLYCGCGAISLYISSLVKSVKGIELNPESIEMARENALINSVNNCEFKSEDVKDFLGSMAAGNEGEFDSFVLDPPRSGIHPKAAEYILQIRPKKIIYVSCNPGTQARDLQLLSTGYTISKIQPVDMFPHTLHIENVVRLDLK
jgi:23S rRNA (uracil1939-C5)-methyltransferase